MPLSNFSITKMHAVQRLLYMSVFVNRVFSLSPCVLSLSLSVFLRLRNFKEALSASNFSVMMTDEQIATTDDRWMIEREPILAHRAADVLARLSHEHTRHRHLEI